MEQWQPIPGWTGYEVSDLGAVRSVDRVSVSTSRSAQQLQGKRLKISVNPVSGRRQVVLSREGKMMTLAVAPLVLLAFRGPGMGLDACHNNDVPSDDRLENLRWDTHSENMRDVVRSGRHNHAGKTHCAHGHEFTAANTYERGGKRSCRACNRAKVREYRSRLLIATQT